MSDEEKNEGKIQRPGPFGPEVADGIELVLRDILEALKDIAGTLDDIHINEQERMNRDLNKDLYS